MRIHRFEKHLRQELILRLPSVRFAIAAGTVILLAACAGDPPTTQLALARSAMQDATRDGAAQRAPQQFASAQDKMARAEAANKSGDYTEARRMAEEAEADAHVASATAHAYAAQTALGTLQEGNTSLQEQLQQQQPTTP